MPVFGCSASLFIKFKKNCLQNFIRKNRWLTIVVINFDRYWLLAGVSQSESAASSLRLARVKAEHVTLELQQIDLLREPLELRVLRFLPVHKLLVVVGGQGHGWCVRGSSRECVCVSMHSIIPLTRAAHARVGGDSYASRLSTSRGGS